MDSGELLLRERRGRGMPARRRSAGGLSATLSDAPCRRLYFWHARDAQQAHRSRASALFGAEGARVAARARIMSGKGGAAHDGAAHAAPLVATGRVAYVAHLTALAETAPEVPDVAVEYDLEYTLQVPAVKARKRRAPTPFGASAPC